MSLQTATNTQSEQNNFYQVYSLKATQLRTFDIGFVELAHGKQRYTTRCLVKYIVIGHLLFVLSSTEEKNIIAAEIHWELCAAFYDQNELSEGTVRQRCRMFKA
jgi:hypothetical protein